MKLTLWTYEGPPHIGAMRVATSMRGVHYLIHAPQGDTYADLLFTMIERRDHRPPVSYTTFQARDLGADTADLVIQSAAEVVERFHPELLMVGESCTAELIQDQAGTLVQGMDLDLPVVPLELPAYSRKENWGAAETFYHLVRKVLKGHDPVLDRSAGRSKPSANLLGPTSLGFRCRDDVIEITRLLDQIGVDVNVVAPWQATVADIARLPDADFNINLYPEISETTSRWLTREFSQPCVNTVPIGIGATCDFIKEIGEIIGEDVSGIVDDVPSRLPWYSRSVDSTYLTGKQAFVFGDATHVMAAARIATEEMGFDLVGIGTYSREFARPVRALASSYGLEALITDDYLEVEQAVQQLQPELILGTQMERHIAKRLGIGCTVISAPVHVEDFPARFSPQMGFEGANVIFDSWIHPLTMGLEEHLLGMFRDDFEFNDSQAPSHLGHAARANEIHIQPQPPEPESVGSTAQETPAIATTVDARTDVAAPPTWHEAAEQELAKIPFFVRGKARKNTERFASLNGVAQITVETLYDAKAHFSR